MHKVIKGTCSVIQDQCAVILKGLKKGCSSCGEWGVEGLRSIGVTSGAAKAPAERWRGNGGTGGIGRALMSPQSSVANVGTAGAELVKRLSATSTGWPRSLVDQIHSFLLLTWPEPSICSSTRNSTSFTWARNNFCQLLVFWVNSQSYDPGREQGWDTSPT